MRALITSINDNYTFALANLLMSIKDNSAGFLDGTRVEIYSDDLTDSSIKILRKIHHDINVRKIDLSEYAPIKDYLQKSNNRWGVYIFEKLFALELVHEYKKFIHFDVDMLVTGD